jgi:tetratricopeptide (TPR) repeat protein
MKTYSSCFCLLTLVLLSFCSGQEIPANPQEPVDSKPAIVFVEPPKTIEEALQQRAKAEEAAAAELQKAEQAYAEKTAAADKELAGFLSQLARQAVASGDLPGAAKAWERILEIQPDSQDAIEFFKAVGRTEIVERHSGSKRANPLLRELAGTWKGTWGTSGNEISFTIHEDGRINADSLQIENNRIIWNTPNGAEQIELIPSGDRLFVLGWSRNKGRSIFSNARNASSIPNHIGVAWKFAR